MFCDDVGNGISGDYLVQYISMEFSGHAVAGYNHWGLKVVWNDVQDHPISLCNPVTSPWSSLRWLRKHMLQTLGVSLDQRNQGLMLLLRQPRM